MSEISHKGKRLLIAFAAMCEQYLSDNTAAGVSTEFGRLDHKCMSAGEEAVNLLIEYRLAESEPRGGTWTVTSRALLEAQR